jgi:16S rRNA (guanine(966)-N(2))-methyltransferase RsmD
MKGQPHKPAPRAARAHELRIIGGQWKRTRLAVADRPGLRPTPDRVRETLFNWLAPVIPGARCLDLFAGTGALGIEATSRGAAEVLLCEQDAALVAQMKAVREKLHAEAVRIERGDGAARLEASAPGHWDVVFLDPPFDQAALYARCLAAAARALRPGGVVYLEAAREWTAAELAPLGLVPLRHLRAGAVHAHLLHAAEGG